MSGEARVPRGEFHEGFTVRSKVVYGNPVRYFLNDVEVSKEEHDAAHANKLGELVGTAPTGRAPLVGNQGYPKKSLALSVHPEQVAEARERNRKHGIDAGYDADGTCTVNSREAQKKLVKVSGFFNKDAGYGD